MLDAGHKVNCILCGEELEYLPAPQRMHCAVCGKEFESNVWCANHHYVCDGCHSADAYQLIMNVCSHTNSRNPIDIAMLLMDAPAVHMHGPEHHVLVGSVLLAAYKNAGGVVDLPTALAEMQRRGQQVPGGVCGYWGACAAGISAGMFVSIVSGSTPMKKKEWQYANRATSLALCAIAECGGPRCCKRDSFLAIVQAVKMVQEVYGVAMELPAHIRCHYSALNKECIGRACPFGAQH